MKSDKFPVWVHGVRVSSLDNNKQAEEKLYKLNPGLSQYRIARFQWRKRSLRLNKKVSSVILEMESPEGANHLIEEGLYWENEVKQVALFDPRCLVTQCYNCQGYGHAAKHCRSKMKCGYCGAGGHNHDGCELKGKKRDAPTVWTPHGRPPILPETPGSPGNGCESKSIQPPTVRHKR